jgi:hypothetical protein
VRRGSESVTCGWPEVERGGVCHDLDGIGIDDEAFPNDSVNSYTHGEESVNWNGGSGNWVVKKGDTRNGNLLGYPRSRHHSAPT